MAYLQQALFLLVIALAVFMLYRRIKFIKSSINLGKPESRSDNKTARFDEPEANILLDASYREF